MELPDEIILNITRHDIIKACTDNLNCPTEIALQRWLHNHAMSGRPFSVGIYRSKIYQGLRSKYGIDYRHEERLTNHVIDPYDDHQDYNKIKAGRYKLIKT